MGKYFGTDGIRGEYGIELTDNIAFMTGNALTTHMRNKIVVIGRDTRLSGEILVKNLIEGIILGGGSVINLDVIPTPAVAYITQLFNADYGIVVTASHNPPQYNGLKIFNNKGIKLTHSQELQIEAHIDNNTPHDNASKKSVIIGDKAIFGVYEKFLIDAIEGDLKGLKIVLDCSNGASHLVAPSVFKSLGAEVYVYNDSSDGNLINKDCGALYPEKMAEKIIELGADLGFAYDGDADRVIAIDEKGKVIDGDDIIYILALDLKSKYLLRHMTVVGTLHTNMGVEKALLDEGIKFIRTDVGDHNVVEAMVWNDIMVGGEQSGHIINRLYSSTGDGVLASVLISDIVKRSGKSLSKLANIAHYPQCNINVITREKNRVMTDVGLQELKNRMEARLKGLGRILLRASGTEPKVRIMVECAQGNLAAEIAGEVKEYIDNMLK